MTTTGGFCRSLVVFCALLTTQVAAQPSSVRTIEIVVGDNMKYSVSTITAKPGEQLRVILKDVGTMPKLAMAHNFVLLKKGVDPKRFVDLSASARETDFVAPAVNYQVLATTGLVGPGETREVSFAAPTTPGTYMFVCTFPGHFALGMKGTLIVSSGGQ
jgi:azurin